MAQTPPPYVDITGIMTADDKHQSVTLVDYDGNARPGQLVVDLATYTLWIGNAQGNVNPVGGGGGNGTPGGFNTYVQFNSAGNFGGSANLTYNSGTSLLTIGGTANVTNLNVGLVGTNLIPSSNVTYSLGNSTNQWKDLWVSNNTIYINSVPVSISSGNTLQVAGANVVTATANGQTNTTQLDVTGNITGGNVIGGNVTANYFIGNGSLLTGLPASYSNANVAAYLPTYSGNVSANYFIGNGSRLTNINGANITGSIPSATTAGTVTTNAQPNITSVGLLNSLSVTGNVTANYFIGDGSQLTNLPSGSNYSNANVAAYLPTYTGNVTANYFIGDGSQLTNLPLGNYSNANVANYLPTYTGNLASLTGNVTTTANVSANYFIGNGSLLTGVISSYGNSNVADYLPTYTGNVSANYFIGNGSQLTNINGSNVTGTVANATYADTSGSATTAATVTTNAQPNITSVGTLTSLAVTGNTTSGNFIGNGQYLSNITAANIVGTVANATNAINALAALNANTAVYANVVFDAAQPNITSVGTLTALTVSGNVTANYFVGNGSLLTGIVSSYGNSNVTTLLGAFTAPITTSNNISANNVSANDIVVANTVTASLFIGDVQGNISGNLSVPGANTQVIFNDNDVAGADSGFTYDKFNNNLTVGNTISVGNVDATGNITANSFSAGPNAITITGNVISSTGHTITIDPSGDGLSDGNLIVQGNLQVTGNLTYVDVGTAVTSNLVWQSANSANTPAAASGGGLAVGPVSNTYASFTYNPSGNTWFSNLPIQTTGGANINGPLSGATTGSFSNTVTASGFIGSGTALTNLTAANVVGQVGNALVAGTVYTNAQPNITSLGTLSALNVSGQSNVVAINSTGNIVTTGEVSANTVVANSATVTGVVIANSFSGNGALLTSLNAANVSGTYGNIVANNISGNGAGLTSLNGSNIVGAVANATYALTSLNSTNATNAINATNAVNSTNSTYASIVTGNAQSNITSVGTLTSLDVTGNVTANYFIGNGSLLTGLPASYGNADVEALLASGNILTDITTQGNIVSGGDMHPYGNLVVSGNVDVSGLYANIYHDLVVGENLTVSGVSTLGDIGNVKITGGTSGQFVSTDGTGNLSFATFNATQYTVTTINDASANTYAITNDQLIAVSKNDAVLIGLPIASVGTVGQYYIIKDSLGSARSANSITISAVGSDTIDGQSTYSITSAYNSITIVGLTANTWGII